MSPPTKCVCRRFPSPLNRTARSRRASPHARRLPEQLACETLPGSTPRGGEQLRGKCLHYYFYFIDAELGLVYLRVPTWAPFRLQFYCNGHSWLARQLTAAGVGFTLADNAFLRIDDWERAQTLANGLSPDVLRRVLDSYAQQCCPVLDVFAQSYHWSFMQVEYATDLVFRSPATLKPLYEQLSRQAILTVTAQHVATLLGHSVPAQL